MAPRPVSWPSAVAHSCVVGATTSAQGETIASLCFADVYGDRKRQIQFTQVAIGKSACALDKDGNVCVK